MDPIGDGVVSAAAERVGGVKGRAPAGACAERLLRDQPEVLAFVLAGTAQISAEARAVAVYLADVIREVFARAGRPGRMIGSAEFVAALRENREMALKIGQAHDRFAERYLRNSRTLRQPAVIRWLTGALLEGDGCPHRVPRDELGPLFIVLKSVVDVLDVDLAAEPLHA
jgi:hypothetical protein